MVETRTGNYTFTQNFALGQYYGTPTESVFFPLERVNVTPVIAEFAVSGVDPSGSRHLTTHPSFVAVRASGRGPASLVFGDIDMRAVNISSGIGISCTNVFLFRIAEFGCSTSRVYDFKLWASSVTDFLVPEAYQPVFEVHNVWQSGLQLPVDHLTDITKILPRSLPSVPNFNRTDHPGQIGGTTIHASGDFDVSQWLYVALAASGCLPLGEYGGTQASGFMLRVTFDLDNIFPLKD